MVELAVTDNGVGFDTAAPRPGHFGLTGMHEQAQLMGAELDLRSRPGAGATLRLRWRTDAQRGAASDDRHDRHRDGDMQSGAGIECV